jgi:anhydro-N-acetylmuramic acid kinase
VELIQHHLVQSGITVVIPSTDIINYKEAIIIALIGVLRWREEYNVIATVTGASRNSISGALWLGTEA